MEKLSQYIKPVDSIEAGQTARILHFHAGRGKFLDIIADIFSRNCMNTKTGYEIIALEAFQTKYFQETDYWLKQNIRLMGLADYVKPVWCDFKTLNVSSFSIDVVLCGFDNSGSRMIMMDLKEDWKAIYKTLKPGGTVCFFGLVDGSHKTLCEEAGFTDYQIFETNNSWFSCYNCCCRFVLLVDKPAVAVMKKPGNVLVVRPPVEEVDTSYISRITTLRYSVSRPSSISQIVSSDFIFPPGRAHRVIELLLVLTIVFFVFYGVFCVGTYKVLSVPKTGTISSS